MRISGGTTGGLWAAPGTSLALSLVTQRREPHQLPGCSGDPGASQPQGHTEGLRLAGTSRSPSLEQLAQFWGRWGSQYPRGGRLYCPSKQPVPGFDQHREAATSHPCPLGWTRVWRNRSFIVLDTSPGHGILPRTCLKEPGSALLKSRLLVLSLPTQPPREQGLSPPLPFPG